VSIAIVLGPLQVYLVVGRVYVINWDGWQRTCLRVAWRGHPKLRWGHSLAR